MRGFRQNTRIYKERVKNIVSEQARGFIYASFVGGFMGAIFGVVLISSVIGWLNFWTQ